METAVLFTQCLQNDFVRPIGKYDSVPNQLHVGWLESTRLMGEDPADGPVAAMMQWAYEQRDLWLVHLIDWHCADDPEQAEHLAHFGDHCIAGTEGAELAFSRPTQSSCRETSIHSLSLNDFQGTELAEELDAADTPQRAGIIGVWSEAKVMFLAYELRTRYPHLQIAVCSALCASSSRSQHFLALDQMQRILGIKVIDSIGAFQEFLCDSSDDDVAITPHQGFPEIRIDGAELSPADQELVRRLFSHCREVSGKALSGGYSGNLVLATESRDLHGHEEASHVVKIGKREDIGKERRTFETVEEVLGNNAPRIADFADLGERGAVKYRYASMSGQTSTFQKLYMSGMSLRRLRKTLEEVFVDKFGRFHRASVLESVNLLDYYEFDAKWASSVRRKVEAIIGGRAEGDTIQLPGGLITPNICPFYEDDLVTIDPMRRDSVRFAMVHGDLNGANILLDEHRNVWLIDFFHAHKGHILRDLIKLENDLLYIFTPINTEADLSAAARISDALVAVEDLAASLPDGAELALEGELLRAWETVRIMRSFYPTLIQSSRNPFQWLVAAMRYAVHTLSFDECSEPQKAWALYTAGRCSDRIMQIVDGQKRLRLDTVPAEFTGGGRLSMTILPGRRDYSRNLADDLATMRAEGVDAVACLVPVAEMDSYGVPELLDRYNDEQIECHHLPIADQRACTRSDAVELVQWCRSHLDAGRHVMLHCVGGIGRTGLIAACVLKAYGLDSEAAINTVRKARTRRAIETPQQEAFVREFHV